MFQHANGFVWLPGFPVYDTMYSVTRIGKFDYFPLDLDTPSWFQKYSASPYPQTKQFEFFGAYWNFSVVKPAGAVVVLYMYVNTLWFRHFSPEKNACNDVST